MTPDLPTATEPARVALGDCLDVLRALPDGCVDAVVTDPPYAEIDRPYGRWTEPEWHRLMDAVVDECRRVLKPTGSAVFVIQPNSERVGRMRPWVWEFMAKWSREWNMVQDAYWWNPVALPSGGCDRRIGLMRPSVKALVWLGSPDCYRDQGAVLWDQSTLTTVGRYSGRFERKSASGRRVKNCRMAATAADRGGVVPFNMMPVQNERASSGYGEHGAATPMVLTRWWVRYICPPGGLVLDPFGGSGTTAVAAIAEGQRCLLIEREPTYVEIARRRVAEAMGEASLFAEARP